ncbi:MAG: 3-deoxy-D-manno-octulosonic acid transferase [Nitrospirae bacterium]|nr:3-deoxy-D-manno-octulosonic acid transferase [Nitrospirota bacterium]
MLLLYNILSAIALLFYFPLLVFKKGPQNRAEFLKERLGLSAYEKTDIWVHAVSVGEVISSLPFLRKLKKELPEINITLSTTTYTGQKIARDRFPEAQRIMYMPVDACFCVNKVIEQLRPRIFIAIETEIWPQLFRRLKKSGSQVAILNGRISKESFEGYRLIKPFMKKALSFADCLYMQGDNDALRIIAIGAEADKVKVMGNFKFDFEPPSLPELNITGEVFVAGSTHRGEEEVIVSAFENVKKTHPDLKLLLAPRRPERFQEVEEILRRRNLSFIRRTDLKQGAEAQRHKGTEHRAQNTDKHETMNHELSADVILLDTIGELSGIYSKATIAFVGGSLIPHGGHNILEPAYWSKPVLFGPHMDNFPFVEQFLREGAGLMVKDSEEIANTLGYLLDNPAKAAEIGVRAKKITDSNAGAVRKAVELIRGVLGNT